MEDTRRKLLENFDAEVHDRLKSQHDQSKEYLDRYARMLWARHEARTRQARQIRRRLSDLHAEGRARRRRTRLPGSYYMSRQGIDGHRYRLDHPLAQHILSIAGSRKLHGADDRLRLYSLAAKGRRHRAACRQDRARSSRTKLSVRGADDQDHIILAAMTDDGARLDPKTAMRLFELPARKNGAADLRLPEGLKQTVQDERKTILDEMAARQSAWFDEEMDKLDNWAEDRRPGLKADLKELDEQIKVLKKEIRQTGNLPDKLALQRKARELEAKRDEAWRAYDAAAKEIEVQKDGFWIRWKSGWRRACRTRSCSRSGFRLRERD